MNQLIIGLCGPAGSGKDTIADQLVKKYHFVKMANADLLKRMAKLAFDFTYEQLWGPSELRNAPDTRYPREHGPATFPDGKPPEHCACCGRGFEDYDVQCYLTPRFALQSLGTEWGRLCFENIWIGRVLGIAQEALSGFVEGHGRLYPTYSAHAGLNYHNTTCIKPAGVVISDVRFMNEVNAIRAAGGKIVRVTRSKAITIEEAEDEHLIEVLDEALANLEAEGTSLTSAASQHKSETELLGIPKDKFDYLFQNSSDMHGLRMQVDRMMDVFKGKIMEFDRGLQDAPPYLREKCKELAKLMSTVCRTSTEGEPWQDGWEVRLWKTLKGDPNSGLASDVASKLKELSEGVNGWFSWRDKNYDAPYFIRRGAWLEEYAERSKG